MELPLPQEKKVNILLVDDRQENLVALESVLNDLGQNLVLAQSGREALKYLLDQDFAVILLDVQMPHMDGFETATLIRQRPRSQHTPIVFLTANNKSDTHVFQGYTVGGVDYVFKPFLPEVLKAKVAAFVELAKKTQELKEEIQHRLKAEEEVKNLNLDLEKRVNERTKALKETNRALQREIAERKELERALQKRAEALAESDQRKDEFLAMLGHELRNPLGPIINAASVLEQLEDPSPPVRRQSDIIGRQSRHLARLVDDLLDVSRITHGKIELRKKRVELQPILEQAIESVRPLMTARAHELEVQIVEEPVFLMADEARLQQIIANLLNNAAKYTNPGGRIQLTATIEHSEVVIRMKDSGVGIAKEMLPHIFDLFIQADKSLDRSQGGLGIGLTLVYNLVQLHGGSVRAHSEGLDRGSVFTIRLPVLDVADEECFPLSSPRLSGEKTLQAPYALKVLVVEDNRDALDSLKDMLEIFGYRVEAAFDGETGVKTATECLPDVILCDIGLPGLSGFGVAKKLRQQAALKETLMIALTGYGQEDDRARAFEAGFNVHLVKPVDPEQLHQILTEYKPPQPV